RRAGTIYVPNGRVVDPEFYLEKLEWLARLSIWLDDNDPSTKLAICGDFNVAPEPIDVWDEAAVHGATHVSPPERAAVPKLRAWGRVHPGSIRSRASSAGGTTGGGISKRTSGCESPTSPCRRRSRPGPSPP